ncbi:MAG: hypothetical protein LBG19_03830 [Prevotellaceae bacterium]|jgi:hypothetical protein|nr:hypothetical protein [Prevotellaceae bacterium]
MVEEVNIAAILYDLLREYGRISVPCLGSFVAEYHSAEASVNRKQIYPPFKEITFSSQEIWNDERLERELANRTGCTIAEAREQVAFWVDELCFKLGVERKVGLDNLGYLTISSGNQVSFTLDKGINLLKEAYGLTPVEVKDVPKVMFEEEGQFKPSIAKRRKVHYDWIIFIGVVIVVAVLLAIYYNK